MRVCGYLNKILEYNVPKESDLCEFAYMEVDVYLRFFLGLIFTLSLIGLLYWLVRRYAPSRILGRDTIGDRLTIKEAKFIDSRNKLLLVQRDNTEHLLLISTQGNLVIERNIKSNTNPTSFHSLLNDSSPEPSSGNGR